MKAWLHVVSVGARVEENYAEPDFTDSVNINFVPAADSAGEARPIKKLPETPLLYRSVKSTQNTRAVKSVLDRIISMTRFGATFLTE